MPPQTIMITFHNPGGDLPLITLGDDKEGEGNNIGILSFRRGLPKTWIALAAECATLSRAYAAATSCTRRAMAMENRACAGTAVFRR